MRLVLIVFQFTFDNEQDSQDWEIGNNVFYSQSKDDLNHIITNAGEIITHNLKPILTLLLKNQDASDSLEPSVFQPPDPSRLFDTMLAAYLINPLKKDYSIRSILDDFLETEITIPNDKNTIIESASSLFELKDVLYRKLFEMGLTDLFFNIEIPLIEVLAHIEYTGVKVQRQILIGLSRDFDKRLNTIIKEIHTLADEPFNINSPQQLSRILFEKLQLPTVKKTKISKLSNVKGKKAQVTYNKVSNAKGYEIQYSTDKKFKKGVKVKKANAKTTKVTLKKLTKGKKYYVRVRAYRVDEDDNRVNGSWSEAKSVKITK